MVDINTILADIQSMALQYAPKLLLAILTLLIGLWVVKMVLKLLEKGLMAKKMEETTAHFLASILGGILKVVLIVAVIGILGVETTSFVAILAALGFAIGMALQGSLGNFAAGVLIIILKPYVKGDMIDTRGDIGKVQKVEVFTTTLLTTDNKTIIIPNGGIFNNSITNFTKEKLRRVDFTFGIGYGDDLKKAQKVLIDIASKHKLVLDKPAKPVAKVVALADSSVNFTVRVWTKTEDYWTVFFDLNEQVKLTFDKEGISIPYNTVDVNISKE